MTSAQHEAEPLELVTPFYIPAEETVATERPHVLKFDEEFAILDTFGNIQADSAESEGLFYEDTRYLSRLLLKVAGRRPLLLSSTLSEDNVFVIADLTNPDLMRDGKVALAKNTVHVLSKTMLSEAELIQHLELENFGLRNVTLPIEIFFDADFADIFEVRGTPRAKRGTREADSLSDGAARLPYNGLDGVRRTTAIAFDPAPSDLRPGLARWDVCLPPRGKLRIAISARCERRDASKRASRLPLNEEDRRRRAADVVTDNESFNDWMSRSRADLDMLITRTPEGLYAYAGIPWFSTAFGRDGIITALQCLWFDPELAAGTLRYLAARQATEVDPAVDAEPGKILHETRKGEMAALGEVPFGRYYGSVDATPLFVVLAASYHARTGDIDLIREIWPNIEAALGWMSKFGDPDRDGFIEYDRQSVNGLVNQGWKDSSDAIFHADGSLAEAPIALVEVQAYAYEAYRGSAELARALALPGRAEMLDAAAERLRQRFEASFWLDDLGTYALALDRNKAPCRIRTSNAGHVLLSGLASPDRAERVAESLTSGGSFSGWGIRTVAANQERYSPLSYHNGSIWPHDNAVIAMGMGRYGLKQPLVQVMTALFEASMFSHLRRLPELFCGFDRRPGSGPTAYPVACSPQAWSSAAVFGALGAMLGISFDVPKRRILFTKPTLPSWIEECRITNLGIAGSSVDLLLRRNGEDASFHVVQRKGDVEVGVTI
ncbi:MAG TPA: amylo-alpha-1,6-glucosidase [Alphaproteobacteria bacterium]|nr:amylo-alpha-1,6-glucosidase [Alphaproteobacteria bacterium]